MRIFQRGLHALSVIAAGLLGGTVGFFVLGCVALRVEDYDSEVQWAAIAWGVVLLGLIIWAIWKKVSYRAILPVIGVCGGFVLYLVWDDAEYPPHPQLGLVVPADSKSYDAYLWFVKGDPHNRLAELTKELEALPLFPEDHAQWPEFFAKHRLEFTQAWKKDTVGRIWVEVMAKFEPEGIYPPMEKADEPIMAFAPYRQSARARWGYVQVLMLDQRYDEAARLLVPFLRANYHLQRGGSLLVTEMIAVVGLRGAFDQLEELANTGKLSSETKAEIAAGLKEAPPLQLAFRNAFLGEQMLIWVSMKEVRKNGEMIKLMMLEERSGIPASRFLWRLFFNPNRSAREYMEVLLECQRLAELRQLESDKKLNPQFAARLNEWHLKNPIGQLIMQKATPAFGKVVGTFWQTEDRRLALMKRLEAP